MAIRDFKVCRIELKHPVFNWTYNFTKAVCTMLPKNSSQPVICLRNMGPLEVLHYVSELPLVDEFSARPYIVCDLFLTAQKFPYLFTLENRPKVIRLCC